MEDGRGAAGAVGREIAEIIQTGLDGLVRLGPPVTMARLEKIQRLLGLPIAWELAQLLQHCDGIQELMEVNGETMDIGWVLYPLDEIVKNTQFYQREYHKQGIFFAGDGAGDPFYLVDSGSVGYFHPIDNEGEMVAPSLTQFYKNMYHL